MIQPEFATESEVDEKDLKNRDALDVDTLEKSRT